MNKYQDMHKQESFQLDKLIMNQFSAENRPKKKQQLVTSFPEADIVCNNTYHVKL